SSGSTRTTRPETSRSASRRAIAAPSSPAPTMAIVPTAFGILASAPRRPAPSARRLTSGGAAALMGPGKGPAGKNAMLKLVLLRHGESRWNLENRFTGWTDVDLTPKGAAEAKEAGRLLLEGAFALDLAYTSVLKRAIRTLWIVQDEMDLMWVPVHRDWRLNERHYGALQGLNKAETAAKYGEQQGK